MPSFELSKNDSFYQLACHTTDTFTSCIRIYEALLPYFETERPDDGASRRLLSIDGMLATLYNELITLKNEITTPVSDDDKDSKTSVENSGLTQVPSEGSQQENIISEASTVAQNVSHKENVFNKLPKRSWEVVTPVTGEENQREEMNCEDSKIKQIILNFENVVLKPNENQKTPRSDLGYICENCNETVTVYNQDLDLSVKLHNQDGCCRGKTNKVIAVQKEEKKINVECTQGQVPSLVKFQEASDRPSPAPAQLATLYKVRDSRYSCIQPVGKGFICTVCNKKMTGAKNFDEHLAGSYHQSFLKESGKEIHKNTAYEGNVTLLRAQLFKSYENKSRSSIDLKESTPSVNVDPAKLIKRLSGSLKSQRQYLSIEKGVIMCNLCGCQVPPTYTNLRDHILGSRHTKNQTEIHQPTQISGIMY